MQEGNGVGDIRDNISKNITFYRKKAGLTQVQLADQLGVKTTSVSSWERGANAPDIETLYKACRIFNVTLDEMYGTAKELPDTIAAHLDGKNYTEEQWQRIEAFAKFIKQEEEQK